jgi:HD-GYP domain-containing protein (c-di-GMP phosphodiesterase class II)
VTFAPLADRCQRLGLSLVEFTGRAEWVDCRGCAPGAEALLKSPDLRSQLGTYAGKVLTNCSVPPEIADGVFAIPLPVRRGKLITGLRVAVGFEPAFFASEMGRSACRAAAISPAAASGFARPMREVYPDLLAALEWTTADLLAAHKAAGMIDEFTVKLSQSYEEVNFLFRLARLLNFVKDPEELFQMLLAQAHGILPFRWIALRFHAQRVGVASLGKSLMVTGDLQGLPVDENALAILGESRTDHWTKLLLPGEHPLATAAGAEILVDPILHGGEVIGVLLAGNKTGEDPDLSSTEIQLLDTIADFIGVFHENIARFAEQRTLFMGTLQALTSAIDAKDRYTRGHSERVAHLAETMAAALGMPAATVENYRIAGLVHDVGKIGVAEAVLRKAGRLTDEEFAEIQRHPQIGHDILCDIPPLAAALPGVLHHHERFDGRGYPHGLSGEAIPLVARVLALADTFDAMSSNRSYRTARPRETVLAEIARCAGAQFDPGLVRVFLQLDFSSFDQLLPSTTGGPGQN